MKEIDVKHEVTVLKEASKLCRCCNDEGKVIRGPFLALVSMDSFEKVKEPTDEWIYKKLLKVYTQEDCFDDLIGYIGSLNKWSIFKKRPRKEDNAEYLFSTIVKRRGI